MARLSYRQYIARTGGKRYPLKKDKERRDRYDEPKEEPAALDEPVSEPVTEPVTEPVNEPVNEPADESEPFPVPGLTGPETTVLWDDKQDVEASVAMPLWRSRDIVWLPLDGLKNQKNAPPWELIVCEEEHDERTGPERLKQREKTLRRAGCVRCVYLDMGPEWTPPGLKWHYMGLEALMESEVFIIHDADWYSWPERIVESLEAVRGGVDWYDLSRGLFYDIPTGRVMEYMNDRKPEKTNLMIAVRTDLVRNIPYNDRTRLLNTYLYQVVKDTVEKSRKLVKRSDPELKPFIDTCGRNRISTGREANFGNPSFPYRRTELNLEELGIPAEARRRLRKMKDDSGEAETR